MSTKIKALLRVCHFCQKKKLTVLLEDETACCQSCLEELRAMNSRCRIVWPKGA